MAGRKAKTGARGEAVVKRLADEKVRWVQLFYTDVFGGYNQVDIPRGALDAEMFETGVPKLDGSSVRGFREIFESDMLLVPDPATLAVIPWNPEAGRTVRFI
jgi:glutamine synthetase